MKDIIRQIYREFEKEQILEKRCRNVEKVMVTYYTSDNKKNYGSIITSIPYIEGVLYNPYENGVDEMIKRSKVINSLLK